MIVVLGSVDVEKLLEEIKIIPLHEGGYGGRQVMLQTVKDSTPDYFKNLTYKEQKDEFGYEEEEFIYPIWDIPYINNLITELNMHRARLLMVPPYANYSYHTDPSKRIHIPVITHEDCFFLMEDEILRCPVGHSYLVDTTKKHTFVNASENCNRIHIVGCVK